MKRILIAGGGASGIMAAMAAARTGRAKVTIIESTPKIGKKILVSGNGRCNLSNTDMDISHYRGHDPDLIRSVLENFGHEETMSFFSGLGLFTRCREGYVYPWCQRATQVLEVISNELERLRVDILTETVISDIEKHKGEWIVDTSGGMMPFDSIVIATGGLIGKSGHEAVKIIKICESLGHHVYAFHPALVQLKIQGKPFKKISGVRTEATIALFIGKQKISEDRGEVQLTDYGISGIPVFQVSRYASEALYQHVQPIIHIDFLPVMSAEELKSAIKQWISLYPLRHFLQFFSGIFAYQLTSFFFKKCRISDNLRGDCVSESLVDHIITVIKCCECPVEDTMGFAHAQVCAGGIAISDLHIPSMESRFCSGLFFAGEILDADGMCGGYNLQWAWSSGYLAGTHAACEESNYD